ncbi:MAG: methyltransferase domain-containing protein [Deltaproteobacteria bacterium]|nr:methyltransferase domain-containing protein [Deltaproteobacteria bacterium]
MRTRHTDSSIQKFGHLYRGTKSSEWRVCSTCGFVHHNPRPAQKALEQFYAGPHYVPRVTPEAFHHMDWFRSFTQDYYGAKIEFALKHSGLATGKVFELGNTSGGVPLLLNDRGWTVHGIESCPSAYTFTQERLKLPSIQQGFFSSNTRVPEKVDLIWINHMLSQYSDVHDVMKGLTQMMQPGGYLFTVSPTCFHNVSAQSLRWMNACTYSMFTHHSLNQLLSQYGFEEVTHLYNGFDLEKDDLWHLARFTGRKLDPKSFYESPGRVRFSVNVVNPLRSFLLFPFYGHHATGKRFLPLRAARVLFRNPRDFVRKLGSGLRRMVG